MNSVEAIKAANTASREFNRKLGLLDSTMIVIGSMIGSGIFIVSARHCSHCWFPGMVACNMVGDRRYHSRCGTQLR